MYHMLRRLYLRWSWLIIYHNCCYSHLYLESSSSYPSTPSRMALKISLSCSIPSSPTTSSSTPAPAARVSLQLPIIPLQRLPAPAEQEHNGSSANSAGRRRRWMPPHLWEISSADNANTYWFEVFSLSSHCCQGSRKGCFCPQSQLSQTISKTWHCSLPECKNVGLSLTTRVHFFYFPSLLVKLN